MRAGKIVAAIIGLTVAFTGTASAHDSGAYGTTFVDGAGVLNDDWGDHFKELGGSLCNGCANSWNTDAVLLWQAVLFSEGFLNGSDIDGKFGPGTAAATRKWQTRYNLTPDGYVGDKSWSRADNNLRWTANNHEVVYVGHKGTVRFHRGQPGRRLDEGSYAMLTASRDNATKRFGGSHHIYLKKRTIS